MLCTWTLSKNSLKPTIIAPFLLSYYISLHCLLSSSSVPAVSRSGCDFLSLQPEGTFNCLAGAMAGHGPRTDHIIIGAKDINKAADHILQVSIVRNSFVIPIAVTSRTMESVSSVGPQT